MKKVLLLTLLYFIVLNSCKNETTGPNQTTDGVTEVKPEIDIFTFYNGSVEAIVPINFTVPDYIIPLIDTSEFEYYGVWARFNDPTLKKLAVKFTGHKFTTAAIKTVLNIKIGNNKVVIPCVINVVDFYLASTFTSNVIDTILMPVGTDFELEMTFKDTAGNITSKNKILSSVNGILYGCGDPNNKISFTYVYKDTTNFNFLLSTHSGITPSIEDRYLRFQIKFSNKEFNVPIKIIY
jgi:hypothetical protein